MTEQQLAEIEQRCERNQGRNDGMIRRDVTDLIAEVRRLNRMVNLSVEMHTGNKSGKHNDELREYLENEVADNEGGASKSSH